MINSVLGIFTNPVYVEGLCTHICACVLTGICKDVFKVWDLIPSLQNLALGFAKFSSKNQQRNTLRENLLKKKEQQVKCEEVLHRMHSHVKD